MKNKSNILIKGGLLYDGSLSEPAVKDILISGDKISAIGSFSERDAGLIIDADGLAVSPGFIDTHAHSDFTMVADPRAEGKISQGITTEINGNCGMSAAPLCGMVAERREEDLRELGIKERWKSLSEYFIILETKGIAINTAVLAGHGNIRGAITGYEDRPPSQSEMDGMYTLLNDTIEQGAIGFSTGLIYPPGIYSATEELIYLSRALKDRDLIYTSHMRSEGAMLVDAVSEVIRIGRETGIRVHISHIKTAGENNWHKAELVIEMMQTAIKSGIRLTCDCYPYTASSTDLDSILPAWTYEGGDDAELNRLQSASEKSRIRKEMSEQLLSKDYWNKIRISSIVTENNRWMEGMNIAEISQKLKMNEMDVIFHILVQERLRVGAIFYSMSEDNKKKFLSLPFCTIGSDSSARSFSGPTKKGKPHPRTFGTFPRIIGKYARDEQLISISEAVHKSTMLAADTFGLKGRGRIANGMHADVVVFDPDKIIDRASFDAPFQISEGIQHVIINGAPAFLNGRFTGSLSGRTLRGWI